MSKAAVKYKLTRGTLQSLQQTTSTFAGIVKSFCKALNWDLLALIVSQFQDRIFFGIHQDLVELMKISVLNGQRARALFDSGYHTLVDISKANVLSIEKCLTDSISFDVQKRDGETNYDADQRNKHRLLFVTGRAGLSVKEVAVLIIEEARFYIRNEMGLENINWSQQEGSGGEKEAPGEGDHRGAPDEVISNASQTVTISENTNQDLNNDRQSSHKRKMSLDKTVATPTKRRNLGQPTTHHENSSSDTSSENSDVDSINLDTLTSFYNDENDDFVQQLQPLNSGPILLNEEHSKGPRLQIVDVTENVDEFNNFVTAFQSAVECGFALSIVRPDNSTKTTNYRCIISSEFYVYGLAFCFQDKYTVHFINLQENDGPIDFYKKIKFIQTVFSRRKLTLQINDAKTQLNTLLKVIPGIHNVNCIVEDSLVAQWLIQPEEFKSFSKLV